MASSLDHVRWPVGSAGGASGSRAECVDSLALQVQREIVPVREVCVASGSVGHASFNGSKF